MALAVAQSVAASVVNTVSVVSSISTTFGSVPVTGNLLVAAGALGAAGLTTAAGWTAIDTTGSGTERGNSAYRVVLAGDTATVTPFTLNVATVRAISLIVWEISGQAATAFINVHGVNIASAGLATQTTLSGPSLAPTVAGALALYAIENQSTTASITTPTGYTLDGFTQATTGSPLNALGGYHNGATTSGTAENPVFNFTSASYPISFGVIIAPGAGGVVNTLALTASLTPTGSVTKSATRALSANLGSVGSQTKATARGLTAALPTAGSLASSRAKVLLLTAGLTSTGTLTTVKTLASGTLHPLALAASLTPSATISAIFIAAPKQYAFALTASLTPSATISAVAGAGHTRAFTAALGFSAGISAIVTRGVTWTPATNSGGMSIIVSPQTLVLPLGGTASFTAYAPGYSSTTPPAIVASTTSSYVVVTGSGTAPGPVTFSVTDLGIIATGSRIAISLVGQPDVAFLPVAVYAVDPMVATGRAAPSAIATVRRRTNSVFGQPSDADILAMLNDGIEVVAEYLESVIATAALPILSANTNILAFPQNVERVRDVNFSTGNPSASGTVVYEMAQLDYDEFIQNTNSSPAGGIGGIPTMYSLISDQSGIMTVQFYPFANAGQMNLHYFKRPTLWTNSPTSYTDLDSSWQECVLLYACSQVMENREDTVTADYFWKKYEARVEENKGDLKRRERKQGGGVIRDINEGAGVFPVWMR